MSFSFPVSFGPVGTSQHTRRHGLAEIAYVAKARIERRNGPLRYAYLAGESNPIAFSVHGPLRTTTGSKPRTSENLMRPPSITWWLQSAVDWSAPLAAHWKCAKSMPRMEN